MTNEQMAALPETERLVIERYFFENRELKEIGVELNVSIERARQIKRKALETLRKNKLLRMIHNENRRHQTELAFSRFRYSPQYFDLCRQLREREMSYGQRQAELVAARRKWDAEEQAANSSTA